MNEPYVSIIIPAFNEELYIGDCLKSILSQDYPKEKMEVVVVDNGSEDNTLNVVREMGVNYLEKPDGKVGAVRNYGVNQTRFDVLAFIDADCVAPNGWLKNAVNKLQECNVGAVGGVYRLRDEPSWVERAWVIGDTNRDYLSDSLVGGSFIVKRNIFNMAGGFNEEINAGEDTKLSKEIKSMGLELWSIKECSVVHLGYPKTLLGFCRRQFWHASSYIKSNTGLGDKTFIAVVLFVLFLFISLLLFLLGSTFTGLVFLVLTLLVSTAFTLKRLIFKSYSKIYWRNVFSAMIVDYMYFVSRGAGLLVSLFYDPFNR